MTSPDNSSSRLRLIVLSTAASLLLSVIFFSPRLWLMTHYLPGTFQWDRAHTFLQQCEQPFRHDVEPAMLWRLLPPIVCHALGLRGWAALAVPWLGIVCATAYVATLLARRLADLGFVFGGTLMFATTSAVLVPVGWLGMNDAWTWLGLLVWAFADSPWARLAACLLADIAWNAHPDFRAERAVDMAIHGNWVGIDTHGRIVLGRALCSAFGGDGFSNKLTVPDSGHLVTLPPHSTTRLRLPVTVRTPSWKFAARIEIRTPQGEEVVGSGGSLDLRSIGLSGLGIVASAGLGLVLASWWLHHFRTTRRRRRASAHPSAGSGGTAATTNVTV